MLFMLNYCLMAVNDGRLLASNILFTVFAVIIVMLGIVGINLTKGKNDTEVRIVIICVLIVLLTLLLSVALVPGWVDYCKKDYVEYVGEFECQRNGKAVFTYLPDGTKLEGAYGLDSGEYYGRVIYSKRTKINLLSEISED